MIKTLESRGLLSRVPALAGVAAIAGLHHERMDGRGHLIDGLAYLMDVRQPRLAVMTLLRERMPHSDGCRFPKPNEFPGADEIGPRAARIIGQPPAVGGEDDVIGDDEEPGRHDFGDCQSARAKPQAAWSSPLAASR